MSGFVRIFRSGRDPQFFNPLANFDEPIELPLFLTEGSSIATEDELDQAFSHIHLTTSLLEDPILALKFAKSGTSPLDVTVIQNSNPMLSFSMTVAEMESLLEGNSELVTFDGLTSEVSVGSVFFNLQGKTITEDDFIAQQSGSCAESGSTDLTLTSCINAVKGVPEPSSTLSLLALGTLGAAPTLKRKLNTSKSTEKEPQK